MNKQCPGPHRVMRGGPAVAHMFRRVAAPRVQVCAWGQGQIGYR
jgi:hypothetical protein